MADERRYRTALLRAKAQVLDQIRKNDPAATQNLEQAEALGHEDEAVDDEMICILSLSTDELAGTLRQIEEALKRIDQGTYGKCLIDGRPIEKRRLDAIPWARLCLTHQTRADEESGSRTFTM